MSLVQSVIVRSQLTSTIKVSLTILVTYSRIMYSYLQTVVLHEPGVPIELKSNSPSSSRITQIIKMQLSIF